MLADWDTDLGPEEWWVVSQGPMGRVGRRGREEGEEEEQGGTLRVPSSILFATREEAEQYLREAMEESDGDEGDDEGDEGDDKGDGGDKGGGKGEEGAEEGLQRREMRGVTRGLPGARMRPGNPPPRKRGDLRVATRKRGLGG